MEGMGTFACICVVLTVFCVSSQMNREAHIYQLFGVTDTAEERILEEGLGGGGSGSLQAS